MVANAEPIGAQLGLFQWFCMGQWILLVSSEGFPDALLDVRLQRIDIFDGPVGIDQPVLHRPNTSV